MRIIVHYLNIIMCIESRLCAQRIGARVRAGMRIGPAGPHVQCVYRMRCSMMVIIIVSARCGQSPSQGILWLNVGGCVAARDDGYEMTCLIRWKTISACICCDGGIRVRVRHHVTLHSPGPGVICTYYGWMFGWKLQQKNAVICFVCMMMMRMQLLSFNVTRLLWLLCSSVCIPEAALSRLFAMPKDCVEFLMTLEICNY